MSKVVKISPVGIDKVIQNLQGYIYDNIGWTNHQSYGRCYFNQTDDGLKAEVYTSKGDYIDCYFDDRYYVTSFFAVSPEIEYNERAKCTVSLIIQANLKKLYAAIAHRADEELHKAVINLLQKRLDDGAITGITTGIQNVYNSLKIDQIKYTDMSDFHCVKFDFSVNYDYEC